MWLTMAAPRSVGPLPSTRSRVASLCSRAMSGCWPGREGMRVMPSGFTRRAPKRFPVRVVMKPMAATAARARSRFSQLAVPKSMLAEQSTMAHDSSSRSATGSRTWGTVVRAVTAQSIRRTSSPSWYSRLSPGSLPRPGSSAW